MNRITKAFLTVLATLVIICSTSIPALAHSGRTDSSGGHKDNKNASGLGSYHYHCGGYPAHLHDGGWCPYRDVFPSGVSITVGKSTLRIGERTSLSAAVYPSNACDTSVDLYCSDTSVVKISGNELVAMGYGTATLTAESFNGKTTTVTIVVKEITADKVTVESSLSPEETIYIGTILQLSAAITPADVDDPSIKWSSSDKNIAIVDSTGVVKTQAAGEVKILATASNGVVGEKAIIVKEKYVESVEIQEDSTSLFLGDKVQLTAAVLPLDATFPQLTWASSDPTIVEVAEDGSITAVNCGTATVTATSTNGISDSIEIKVDEVVAENLEIIGKAEYLICEEAQLESRIYPENTSDKHINWTSSNPAIASIDSTGTIRFLSTGTVTISATQKDVTASIQIEVKPKPVEQITIRSTATSGNKLFIDETMTLSATVYPGDATFQYITWISSNPDVVSITNLGEVTAHSLGKAIISASTPDGFVTTYEVVVQSKILNACIAVVTVTAILTGVAVIVKKARHNVNR